MRDLTRLHVIAVRYRNARPAPGDERGVDALASDGAYGAAGVPFDVTEPRLPVDDRAEGGRQPDGAPVEGVTRAAANPCGREVRATGDLCGIIAADVARAVEAGSAVLLVGGNCSHAPGVVGGLLRAYGSSARVGLVWFDAHGDFNTPDTSPSGSLGGMPVAVLAGLAHDEWRRRAGVERPVEGGRILLAGCRALDAGETLLIGSHGVRMAAASGPDFDGALDELAAGSDVLYVHVDVDVLDSSLVPGHRSAVGGGASIGELVSSVAKAAATGKVAAMAVVSTATVENERRGADASPFAAPDERSAPDLSSAVEDAGRSVVKSAALVVRGALRAWRSAGLPQKAGGRS